MANELPVLPDVEFVEVDAQQVIDEIIGGFEEIEATRLGDPTFSLGDGDPRRLFLLSIAYVIANQRQQINETGKSNLLYYANDDFLDHLGAFRQTPRIEEQAAVTTQRFTLSSTRPTNVGIPAGTRVTADNALFWETTEAASIISGQLFVDIPVQALTAGVAGNDLQVGVINRLVDPIPYVATVANTEITTGGRDRESNDAYRFRIYQAPSGFSIAGPEEAYKFHALSANSAIVDVSATSPSAGVVDIRPLMENGQIPTQAVLDQVEAAVTPDDIRPLTDLVQVNAPNVVNYDLNLTYYIRKDDSASVTDIQGRVNDAVTAYIEWQREKLGRDINPDQLVSRLIQAGVKRSAITTPTLQAVLATDVAFADNVTVNYGGLEDD